MEMKKEGRTKSRRSDQAFLPTEMHHYVSLTPDGFYHVENMVGAMAGQHHVHSGQSYRKWKKGIGREYLHFEKAEFCACGLGPGYVKEFNGDVWFNEEFE